MASNVKVELIKIFSNSSQKTEEEGALSNSFYEANGMTQIPKQGKWVQYKKEKYRLVSLMNIDRKVLNKIIANWV